MHQVRIFVLCFITIQWVQASKIVDSKTMIEKQARNVTLVCRFEKLNKEDRVMWSKDSVILSVNDEIAGDRRKYEIVNKYDLIIKNVGEQDSGRYLCQNFDQVLSINILLTILTQPSKPDIQQANKSLIENTMGKFLCITQGGNPPPTFNWLINQVKVNESLYRIHNDTRQSYSELTLLMEKRFHNGLLTCQIENQALDKPLITSYGLNIEYKPEVRLRHGQTIVSNHNILVVEEDYMALQCDVESNPPILKSVTWLKNGVIYPGINSSLLTLQKIQRSDDGEYACVASNAIGRSQSSVHIRVQYPPSIYLNGGGLINENERLTLTCHVDAYPSVDYYQWFKNHQKLNTSSLTTSFIIEKVSKDDAGVYVCMVKNTLKYSNGSSIEKYNKTQTRVIINYAPKVHTSDPIVAADLLTTNVKFQCEVDSHPESTIIWIFNNNTIFNSNRYSIVQNKSTSYLTIPQIQFKTDYGLYLCKASNKLGYNSTTIQLRPKDVPDPAQDLNVIDISYSTISLKWKPGFDGGWPQSFRISLDPSVQSETNESSYTFTNLQHLEFYNITVRAYNRLGQSLTAAFIRVQTKDIPIKREDLPIIEHSSLQLSERIINYRLNDSTFASIKVPLCIRIEVSNQTNFCQRIVTSSGILKLDESHLHEYITLSICIDQYENFCGETVQVQLKREASFNWMFILLLSIVIVALVILFGLGIFCFIINRQRFLRNTNHSRVIATEKLPSQNQIDSKSVISTTNSPSKYFSNVTYPERQQVQNSYSKIGDGPKIDQLQGNTVSHRQLSNGSSDPILSNPNTSSLSGSDHLTITDMNPTDLSSMDNDLNATQSQYIGYGFPIYVAKPKEDVADNVCSTSLKSCQSNKKTVYEVVV